MSHMTTNRDRQVQNLRHYFPTLRTIASDCYDIPFTITTQPQTNFTLRVLFPMNFPTDSPRFQLWPRSNPSSLLDEQGFVRKGAFKGLAEWGSGSSLGLVAFEMIKLFEMQPPQSQQSQQQSQQQQSRQYQSMPNVGNQKTQQPQQQHQQQQQPKQQENTIPKTDLPSLSDPFPELSSLSLQEIESLLQDEKEFDSFFNNLSDIKKLQQQHHSLRTTNLTLAQQNLDLFEGIDYMQGEVQTKQKELTKAVEEYKKKEKELEIIASSHSPEGLLEKIEKYVGEAEERTEGLGDKFEDGEMNFDEFLKCFVKEREMYHMLAAKKESLELYIMKNEGNS